MRQLCQWSPAVRAHGVLLHSRPNLEEYGNGFLPFNNSGFVEIQLTHAAVENV